MQSFDFPSLEVHDSATGDVSPTSAFVHLVLSSDRFFSGRAAFEKAEELRRLAAALSQRGIPESALTLEGVSVDVSSGMFTKSSSVTYRVRVVLEDLELVAGVLDAVSEAKKISLTHVEWNYDDNSVEEHLLLRKAGARAAAKARVLAESVGATLGALRSIREERIDQGGQPPTPMMFGAAPVGVQRSRSVSQELNGLEMAPKKRLTIRVSAAYALGE